MTNSVSMMSVSALLRWDTNLNEAPSQKLVRSRVYVRQIFQGLWVAPQRICVLCRILVWYYRVVVITVHDVI